MFISSYFISRGWKLWSVNHTSMYENSESKVLKNKKILGEIFNNWPNVLRTSVCRTLVDNPY